MKLSIRLHCKLQQCCTSIDISAGLWPFLQIVMTANAFIWSYIALPYTPQEHAVAMRVKPPLPVSSSLTPQIVAVLVCWHFDLYNTMTIPAACDIRCFCMHVSVHLSPHACMHSMVLEGICSVDDCLSRLILQSIH